MYEQTGCKTAGVWLQRAALVKIKQSPAECDLLDPENVEECRLGPW